jgi:hypothetical protein
MALSSILDDMRHVYVNLTDLADRMRQEFSEFSLGLASGYDDAADLLREIIRIHE